MENPIDRNYLFESFIRYTSHGTPSVENSTKVPTSESQTRFLHRLHQRLQQRYRPHGGQVVRGKTGYIYFLLPANCESKKKIGFVAHVDTHPQLPSEHVNPLVQRNYSGGDIILEDGVIIKEKELLPYIGHDIISSDGTTLLGADDKAGIAAITSALKYLTDYNISHPDIYVLLTHDEEIGKGTAYLEPEKFPVNCAYTIDGGRLGEFEIESFNASVVEITILGQDHHPGYGKGVRKNSMYVGAKIIGAIPKELLAENTEDRCGYIEPYITLEFGTEKTQFKVYLRDFEQKGLLDKQRQFEEIVEAVKKEHPNYEIELKTTMQYGNMKGELLKRPEVIELARKAYQMAGVEVIEMPIRGGTDGCELTLKYGIPTPNIFTGTHNGHSRREFVTVQSMEKAAEVIVYLSQLHAQN